MNEGGKGRERRKRMGREEQKKIDQKRIVKDWDWNEIDGKGRGE